MRISIQKFHTTFTYLEFLEHSKPKLSSLTFFLSFSFSCTRRTPKLALLLNRALVLPKSKMRNVFSNLEGHV